MRRDVLIAVCLLTPFFVAEFFFGLRGAEVAYTALSAFALGFATLYPKFCRKAAIPPDAGSLASSADAILRQPRGGAVRNFPSSPR